MLVSGKSVIRLCYISKLDFDGTTWERFLLAKEQGKLSDIRFHSLAVVHEITAWVGRERCVVTSLRGTKIPISSIDAYRQLRDAGSIIITYISTE